MEGRRRTRKLQEATIEEKIRVWKTDRAKKRAEATRRREKCQPAMKRRKMDRDLQEGEETGDTITTVEEKNTTNQRGKGMTATPKKRKVRGGAEDKRTPAKNPKRKRMNENIKKYISCRKWRDEEDQMNNDQEQLEGEQQHHQHEQLEDVSNDQVQPEGEQHHHHHAQGQQEGDHQQHHPLDQEGRVGEENKAVTTACMNRMPGSKLQASQGGPCPRTTNINPFINILTIEVERGQGTETGQDDHQDGQGEQEQGDGHPGDHQQHHQDLGQQEGDNMQRQAKMTTKLGRESKTNEMATQIDTIRTWDSRKETTTNNTTIPRDSRKEITSNTIHWTWMRE
jgi:hypothetical protein